jgi:hypothetical protein
MFGRDAGRVPDLESQASDTVAAYVGALDRCSAVECGSFVGALGRTSSCWGPRSSPQSDLRLC